MDLETLIMLKALSGGSESYTEETVTGNPLSFTTNVSKPLSELIIPFLFTQEGSGAPSEQNLRNILGLSNIIIDVSDGVGTPDRTTVPLGETRYGGTLNVLTGEMTVDWGFVSGRWGDLESSAQNPDTGFYQKVIYCPFDQMRCVEGADYGSKVVCNCIDRIVWDTAGYSPEHMFILGSEVNKKIYLYANYDNDLIVQVAVRLASPVTVQLTPAEVSTIVGTNVIESNGYGNMVAKYLKRV